MQFMSDGRDSAKALAILLPAMTISTALFVFNVERILDLWGELYRKCTIWLQRSMQRHPRNDWKARATALREDEHIGKAPIRKAKKRSSGWVYLFYMAEYLALTLPISELATTLGYIVVGEWLLKIRSGSCV
jgi:hypothetical protein